jgi:hypothetical protein
MIAYPTLLIGLGGTGRTVLLSAKQEILANAARIFAFDGGQTIRRELEQELGGPGRLPFLKMLSIDSSISERTTLNGSRISARLDIDEQVMASVNVAMAAQFQRVPNTDPAMARWFDPSLLNAAVPQNGCGQTRPWGRVAFMHNYAAIREAISAAITGLRGAATQNATQRMGLQLAANQLRVVIAFSGSGGTGAGMFLDVAYLVRDIVNEQGNPPGLFIEAIFGLPSLFSNDQATKFYANGYASLLELEHYCRTPTNADGERGNPRDGAPSCFKPAWPGRAASSRIDSPAYNAVWLLGNGTRGKDPLAPFALDSAPGPESNTMSATREALLRMAGEWLFLRFVPIPKSRMNYGVNDYRMAVNTYVWENVDVGAAAQVAVQPFLQGAGDDEQRARLISGRRFGAFGLSKIQYDTFQVFSQSSYRLAIDALGDMERVIGVEPDKAAVDEGWSRVFAGTGQFQLEQNLVNLIDTEGGGQPISLALEQDLADQQQRWVNGVVDGPDNPIPDFDSRVSEFYKTRVASGNQLGQHDGTLAQEARSRRTAVRARLKGLIEAALTDALAKPGIGFAVAERQLERLLAELASARTKNDDTATTMRQTCTDLLADASAALDCIPTYRWSLHQTHVRTVCADLAYGDAREAMLSQHEANLNAEAVILGDDLAEDVKAFKTQLSALERNLKSTLDDLRTARRIASELPNGLLNDTVSEQQETTFLINRAGLSLESMAVRQNQTELQPLVSRLWARREEFGQARRGSTIEKFMLDCESVIEHHLQRPPNAAARFVQSTNVADGNAVARERVRLFLRRSEPWVEVRIPADTRFGATLPMHLHNSVLLADALPDNLANDEEAVNAHAEAEEATRLVDMTISQIAADWSRERFGPDVIAVSRLALAFPLSVLVGLPAWKRTYEQMLAGDRMQGGDSPEQLGNTAFHIEADVDRYSPIVLPSPEEGAALARAAVLFVQGIVLGLIVPEHTSGPISRLVYRMYAVRAAGTYMELVGSRTRLLQRLSVEGNHQTQLDLEIQRRLSGIRAAPPLELNRMLAAHLANLEEPSGPMSAAPLMRQAIATILSENSVEAADDSQANARTREVRQIYQNRAESLQLAADGTYVMPQRGMP